MDPRTSDWAPPAQLNTLRNIALMVGVFAAAASIVGAFADSAQFFRSYITGYMYVLAAPIGALGLLMINHVTRGAWGVMGRRILEAATRTLPLMLLLFIPIIIGMRDIYVWSDPDVVAHDTLIADKSAYLNSTFFIARAAFYFVVWMTLSFLLSSLSKKQDADGDVAHAKRMQAMSAGGIVIFVLTVTFAIFDWLMSLDPHWFSSIYGVYYIGGACLTILAITVIMSLWLSRFEPMKSALAPKHFHDWGKLMLAFTMLWAYFSVSQLIIVWSGNLPEEVPWYLHRTSGMFSYFPHAIVVLHFFVPFVMLLSTDLKRDSRRLAVVAVFILVMRFVDMYWQSAPSMDIEAWHWLDLGLPIAIGGLWVAYFAMQLSTRPLLPRNEPFLQEALKTHG